jgi:diacylglycerol kinase family enzyme
MYYYIFDIRQCKNKAQGEKIKDYLSLLGIGGEYVFPSQARSAGELVKDALGRNFSTIVAIGNDELINNVATELVGEKAAFGIIPLNASEQINKLVNGYDWKQAATNLRYRKIKEIKLGQMENRPAFFNRS